jgi:hypothetical protein
MLSVKGGGRRADMIEHVSGAHVSSPAGVVSAECREWAGEDRESGIPVCRQPSPKRSGGTLRDKVI